LCGDWLATCPSIENQNVGASSEARVSSHSCSRVTSDNTTENTLTAFSVVGGGFTSHQLRHFK